MQPAFSHSKQIYIAPYRPTSRANQTRLLYKPLYYRPIVFVFICFNDANLSIAYILLHVTWYRMHNAHACVYWNATQDVDVSEWNDE